jgi:hypothetical protein
LILHLRRICRGLYRVLAWDQIRSKRTFFQPSRDVFRLHWTFARRFFDSIRHKGTEPLPTQPNRLIWSNSPLQNSGNSQFWLVSAGWEGAPSMTHMVNCTRTCLAARRPPQSGFVDARARTAHCFWGGTRCEECGVQSFGVQDSGSDEGFRVLGLRL